MNSYYWSGQMHHDPSRLPQPPGGSANYYSEVPARAEILRTALDEVRMGPVLPPEDFGLKPILAVHDAAMVMFLQSAYRRMASETGREQVVVPESFAVWRGYGRRSRSIWGELGYYCYDTSSPIFAATWDAAYWSAQCALSAAADVAGGAPLAYALCRPPGHHAGRSLYGGFCYLNNAAVAAESLLAQGGRVAVLDIDYHHGNGTQDIFYSRDDLFFCSLHADPDMDYPFYWGFADETGAGSGSGYTLNLPLPLTTDETGYLAALAQGLGEVERFWPDFLVVSLGFDTYVDDPVGGFQLQTDSFGRIAARIAALGRPLVLIQEGGYAIDRLAANFLAFLCGLQ